MSAGLTSVWEDVRSSLYFIPGLLVLGAAGLASGLLVVDAARPDLADTTSWLFGGTASAGRTLLSTIATSLITVISIAFSVTMVALQQAASNLTPRVLRTFTRDKGNQVVLGVYIGTFAYALLVMRQIRESDGGADEFVPALSISVAILLALVAMGLLVYYIHHTSRALEVTWILGSIAAETEEPLESLYPEELGRGRHEPPLVSALVAELCPPGRGATEVRARDPGYLRRLDFDQLKAATPPDATLVRVHPVMGAYVLPGETVLSICPARPLDEDAERSLLNALAFGAERSVEQDELFGIRQMVDIAVKALSPGVNDPTTAEQCLDRIGAVLAQLMNRAFPSPRREADGRTYLIARWGFREFVGQALDQIRRGAASDVKVTLHFVDVARRLAEQAPNPERRRVLDEQIEAVLDGLPADLPERDRALITAEAARARQQLDRQL